MSIFVRELRARDYRNFERYLLEPSDTVTILAGRNAVGKTNLVEAVQLLTSGASFRKPAPGDLVRQGSEAAELSLRLEGEGRVIDIALEARSGKRTFKKNGKRCQASGVRGIVPSVLFCPDDLDMVKRSAKIRRSSLDSFGIQLSEQYAQLASAYERIVEQRNSLLKEPWCTRDMLGAWNESLANTGSSLMIHRMALLDRITEHMERIYEGIAQGERLEVFYDPSIADDDEPLELSGLERGELLERVRGAFLEALSERADEEIRRGATLVGPHRDEVAFSVDGRPARTFASQGQQRSIVLAWKLAEVEVTRDILGRPPVLLLDDVMSELDEVRRSALLKVVTGQVQTIITTTNLGYFSDEVLERSKVVEIGG